MVQRDIPYEGFDIIAIFSDAAKAETARKIAELAASDAYLTFSVEEFELDPHE